MRVLDPDVRKADVQTLKPHPVVIVLDTGTVLRRQPGRTDAAAAGDSHHLLLHTVRQVIDSGLPMLVVTSPDRVDDMTRLVARRDVLVATPSSAGGRGAGVNRAIAAAVGARASAAGWLLLPASMALVRPSSLQRVAAALAEHPLVYAQHGGRRGQPVGYGPELYSELIDLAGDDAALRLLTRYPALGIEVDDPGVLMSIATEQALLAARDRLRLRAGQAAD